ncbi:tensin-1-like isoform X2 [Strongylocentrotus purpuratus]|uniref:SH2 domain-containing protein n=1 Tax=Strongylocentrotus purpuratus TaxID=7668 RepID=A0A7M7N1H0_STRPU|nr:tensin-1-like isoform X2 [Strongylocentrotus purpuratus]
MANKNSNACTTDNDPDPFAELEMWVKRLTNYDITSSFSPSLDIIPEKKSPQIDETDQDYEFLDEFEEVESRLAELTFELSPVVVEGELSPLIVEDEHDKDSGYSSIYSEGQLPSPGGLSGKGGLNGSVTPPTLSGRSTPSNFYYTQKLSPYGSSSSLADPSVEHVRFVKDLSAWWYKPSITRDDAINILKDRPPGTFIVRDSNSFPGAFGLALKVAQVPANTTPRKGGDPQSELVRHFLIEPNARGVRLKGCVNEPVFSSLSALIYQHTLTQLALPIKLVLPDMDSTGADATDSTLDPKSAASLLHQGAACKVLYIDSVDMESLTGSESVREGLTKTLSAKKKPEPVVVHFKVSSKGITLTDTQRKLFFRKHYPVKSILFCGMDPLARKYPRREGQEVAEAKIFGFVARKPGSLTDNQCHLFADWEVEQPASAIVSFVTKVMLGSSSKTSVKTP